MSSTPAAPVTSGPITLVRLDPTGPDRPPLVDFLTSHRFPFHMSPTPTREQAQGWIDDGAFRDDDNDTYWVEHETEGRLGFLRLEEITDGAPLFDLRLAEAARGRGLGAHALRAATELVFTTMPEVHRFEGQTREDNLAMRRTFVRCGFVKEAHYREGWPVEGGTPLASVAYAILRRDWESGTTTELVWDDLPA